MSTERKFGDYELRQLIGRYRRPDGRIVQTANDVDQVFRGTERIGFVARKDGAPFCPQVRRMSAEDIQAAVQAITEIRKADGVYRVPAPSRTVGYPNVDQATIEAYVRQAQEEAGQADEDDEDADEVNLDTDEDDELDLG